MLLPQCQADQDKKLGNIVLQSRPARQIRCLRRSDRVPCADEAEMRRNNRHVSGKNAPETLFYRKRGKKIHFPVDFMRISWYSSVVLYFIYERKTVP